MFFFKSSVVIFMPKEEPKDTRVKSLMGEDSDSRRSQYKMTLSQVKYPEFNILPTMVASAK